MLNRTSQVAVAQPQACIIVFPSDDPPNSALLQNAQVAQELSHPLITSVAIKELCQNAAVNLTHSNLMSRSDVIGLPLLAKDCCFS